MKGFFYRQKGAGKESYTIQKKRVGYLQGHFPLGNGGVCEADYLTSADRGTPDRLV